MAISPAPERIFTVGELTRRIRAVLESGFPSLWVRGEISGIKRHDSGHVYFALKEGRDALIDCAMWRTSALRLSFEPRDGMEVEAYGNLSVYEPRGRYQLNVKELRPAGLGALLLALEELKRRLQAEGLFAAERKRELPRYPRRVGLVTSPVGAAVRDVVKVLRARWPSIGIVLAPVRVQGPGAAAEIANAIGRFGRWGGADVLIVGRGGGSLEDLWAFNEEIVVRAIAASRVPVIAAVGHEVDWTLTDLVADRRAATPSNAAEIAVCDRVDVLRRIDTLRRRSERAVRDALARRRRTLDALIRKYGFRRPQDSLAIWQQRIDELRERMRGALLARVRVARERLRVARDGYGLREWPRLLRARHAGIDALHARLDAALARALHDRRVRLLGYGDRLRALSPRQVLERGFCIVRAADGRLVRGVESLAVGERLALEFARGEADARVEGLRPGRADGT